MKDEAIRAIRLQKTYSNGVEALKAVDLSLPLTGIFTLVGPNGAGKTTFLRILSTQLLPTSGQAFVLGYDVVREAVEVRKHVAVAPQDAVTEGLYTPWDYCYYFARLRGMSTTDSKLSAKESLDVVGLWELRNRLCAELSGGQRKRVIVAAALATQADILMLDEPTSGLDPIARRDVWNALNELVRRKGKTVLLTTHSMEEAELVSDTVIVINKGRIVATGPPDEIRSMIREKFKVIVHGHTPDLPKQKHVQLANKTIVYFRDENEATAFLTEVMRAGLRAEILPASLEDAFIEIVRENA